MGGPRGATTSAPAAAPLLVSRGPAARYFPRDVFFCFFTFKLTIGAFAPVPRETGLDTGCFFDFPAMAILLGRGEWHGRSHRTGRGRMRCLCDGLGLSPKRWRVSAKCHSYRLGCESLNGRSWLLADGHQGHRLCDRSHKCGMLCKRPVERCSRRGLSTPLQLFPLARAQRGARSRSLPDEERGAHDARNSGPPGAAARPAKPSSGTCCSLRASGITATGCGDRNRGRLVEARPIRRRSPTAW